MLMLYYFNSKPNEFMNDYEHARISILEHSITYNIMYYVFIKWNETMNPKKMELVK